MDAFFYDGATPRFKQSGLGRVPSTVGGARRGLS